MICFSTPQISSVFARQDYLARERSFLPFSAFFNFFRLSRVFGTRFWNPFVVVCMLLVYCLPAVCRLLTDCLWVVYVLFGSCFALLSRLFRVFLAMAFCFSRQDFANKDVFQKILSENTPSKKFLPKTRFPRNGLRKPVALNVALNVALTVALAATKDKMPVLLVWLRRPLAELNLAEIVAVSPEKATHTHKPQHQPSATRATTATQNRRNEAHASQQTRQDKCMTSDMPKPEIPRQTHHHRGFGRQTVTNCAR